MIPQVYYSGKLIKSLLQHDTNSLVICVVRVIQLVLVDHIDHLDIDVVQTRPMDGCWNLDELLKAHCFQPS